MLVIQDVSFAIPPKAGKIVSMCQFRDRILVACEYGLYELQEDGLHSYSMYERLVAQVNEAEKRT